LPVNLPWEVYMLSRPVTSMVAREAAGAGSPLHPGREVLRVFDLWSPERSRRFDGHRKKRAPLRFGCGIFHAYDVAEVAQLDHA